MAMEIGDRCIFCAKNDEAYVTPAFCVQGKKAPSKVRGSFFILEISAENPVAGISQARNDITVVVKLGIPGS